MGGSILSLLPLHKYYPSPKSSKEDHRDCRDTPDNRLRRPTDNPPSPLPSNPALRPPRDATAQGSSPCRPEPFPKRSRPAAPTKEHPAHGRRAPKLPYKLGGILRTRLQRSPDLIGRPYETLDLCRAVDFRSGTPPRSALAPCRAKILAEREGPLLIIRPTRISSCAPSSWAGPALAVKAGRLHRDGVGANGGAPARKAEPAGYEVQTPGGDHRIRSLGARPLPDTAPAKV